jgi:phosphoenolpyruvate carboxykinase (ATP)
MTTTQIHALDLAPYGLTVGNVHRNLSTAKLYEHAIRYEPGTSIADSGALIAYSGAKTGRSPLDKRIVKQAASEKDVWWGPVNRPMDERGFHLNRERAIDYLNTRERLYVIDAFAGWHPRHRLKIRVICARPYHALFMHTMLIRPTARNSRRSANRIT